MSQTKTGLSSPTNASATVLGNGTLWLTEVSIGDFYIKAGNALPIVYTVGGIVSDTELTLTAPYGDATEVDIAYVIHRDFFPNGNGQLFSTDVETAGIYNETAKSEIVQGDLGTASLASAERLSNTPYCTDSGIADAYVLTVDYTNAAVTAYNDGDQFRFMVTNTPTGGSTIKVGSGAVVALVKKDGTAITASYFAGGDELEIQYDLANNRFFITSGTLAQLDGQITPAVSGNTVGDLTKVGDDISNFTGIGRKNLLINAGFRINQEEYVSSATLAAGEYGHDMNKAGSSGGDYTFTQLASTTEITILAGKSLINEIESKEVEGGTYVLSWEGTAKARAGVDSLIPLGTFVVSPLVINAQTASTVMSVEFDEGTLKKKKLERASVPTEYREVSIGNDEYECFRHFERIRADAAGYRFSVGYQDTTIALNSILFYREKRIDSVVISSSAVSNFTMITAGAIANITSLTTSNASRSRANLAGGHNPFGVAGNGCMVRAISASAFIDIDARLIT
jgi:hypothetical protein